MIIRKLRTDEIAQMDDFLYEAIFVPEGQQRPERDILRIPELDLYVRDFGTGVADTCLCAESEGRVIGMAWARIMEDYGHVDDKTPSLAIALFPEYRGRGIGTKLMRRLLEELKSRGYERASLSVQTANPAVRLYERMGFSPVRETDGERIMVCHLERFR